MELFGFSIKRKQEDNLISIAPKIDEDGAVLVNESGVYGTFLDLDGAVRTEAELVNKYREMALYPEVDMAIDDITNEVITQEPEQAAVELILDDLKQSDKVKKLVIEEFKNILNLLDFNQIAYEIFRRWYVDGRLYYHVVIDNDNPRRGILELRYIDPRKIRKIKPIKKKRVGVGNNSTTISVDTEEYFIYNDAGFAKTNPSNVNNITSATTGLKLSKDSIVHCTSGLGTIGNGDLVIGYLHKAIKPLNVLKSMEDSLVIYRISRAPERRIFYIDTGNMPPVKAEQHMRNQMQKFKNKLVFDANTGEIRSDKRHLAMTEDFWLNRRGEGKGTEISTLPGGAQLSELDDVEYFQKKLYRSLNVPISRLEPEGQFMLGRSSEISRDEVKFAKFINRLRVKFSNLFLRVLERQLILKNVISADEWEEFKENIRFKFSKDNYYAELKETEVLRDRVAMLRDIDDYVGKFYSGDWVRRHVLRQSDEEIKQIDSEIKKEADDPRFALPDPEEQDQEADTTEQPPQQLD